MKHIWLIRHAESIANIGKQTTIPKTIGLSDFGKCQAEKLAETISEKPELIITSPYIRTLQTAKPLLAKFPNIRHEQWPIHEFTYLSPVKCKNTTVEDRIPWAMEYWDRSDPYYCEPDGAESFNDFLTRIKDSKKKLNNRPEKFIIFFSHYQFIAAFHWLNDYSENTNTPQAMADYRQFLLSFKLNNVGITKQIV